MKVPQKLVNEHQVGTWAHQRRQDFIEGWNECIDAMLVQEEEFETMAQQSLPLQATAVRPSMQPDGTKMRYWNEPQLAAVLGELAERVMSVINGHSSTESIQVRRNVVEQIRQLGKEMEL